MTQVERGVTAMSRFSCGDWGRIAGDLSLAWRWLAVPVMVLCLDGCVFPEPPDYQRQRTPPFLWSPIPSTTEILSVKSGEILNLNVNVSSEDDGEALVASLYMNYLIDNVDPQAEHIVAPGTLAQGANEPRQVVMTWKVVERPTPGTCEQLSLVVTHVTNRDKNRQYRPINDSDVAVITWWLDINSTEETLGECPRHRTGSAQ